MKKAHNTGTRRTLGYTRVSTEDQVTEGVSLTVQEARIHAYAVASERTIDGILSDPGISAKNLKRPALQTILDGIARGEVGCVVVVKLDRLTRSVKDLGYLLELMEKHQVALVSLSESLDTSTAAGRMIINMLGVVAQWEREQTAERVVAALGYMRATGKVYGHPPFGYRREGDELVPVPEQLQAVEDVRRMQANGVSLRKCAAWLESLGFTPPRGGDHWHANSIREMLVSKVRAA